MELTINKLTANETRTLERILRNYERGAEIKKNQFLGCGATSSAYRLGKGKVVRIQKSFYEGYEQWIKLCTSQKSKHFPKVFYYARHGARVVSVLEELEHLDSEARNAWNLSPSDIVEVGREWGSGDRIVCTTAKKLGIPGAYTRKTLLRVHDMAEKAGLIFNDCHSGNVMLRTVGKKKVLVITDPVV